MSSQNNPVSTNGWDTIYLVPFTLVNQAIIDHASSPPSFSQSMSSDDGEITFTGTFDHWQLTTGGDTVDIMLNLPITSAELTAGTNNMSYNNISALVQVNLDWVEDPSNSSQHNLQISTDRSSIEVVSIISSGTVISDAIESIMRQLLQSWLIDNITDFEHTFAAVDINAIADQGVFSWMNPTSLAYAVADDDNAPDDITKSVLGVLCMTEGRTEPDAVQVPGGIIPSNSSANSVLLISPERLIDKMFYPNVDTLFHEADLSDFQIGNTGTFITNINPVTFGVEEIKGGKKTLKLGANGFRLELLQDQINMNYNNISFNYGHGFSVHFNNSSNASLSFPNGQFNLGINGSTSSIRVVQSNGSLAGAIAGGFAASLAGSLFGGFLGGAISGGGEASAETAAEVAEELAENGAVEGVELAGMAGEGGAEDAMSITDEVIEAAANEEPEQLATSFSTKWAKVMGSVVGSFFGVVSPVAVFGLKKLAKKEVPESLGNFGSSILQPVQWPSTTQEGFTVTDGSLNGALCIYINFNPNTN